jgi:hypothetical protein
VAKFALDGGSGEKRQAIGGTEESAVNEAGDAKSGAVMRRGLEVNGQLNRHRVY